MEKDGQIKNAKHMAQYGPIVNTNADVIYAKKQKVKQAKNKDS